MTIPRIMAFVATGEERILEIGEWGEMSFSSGIMLQDRGSASSVPRRVFRAIYEDSPEWKSRALSTAPVSVPASAPTSTPTSVR